MSSLPSRRHLASARLKIAWPDMCRLCSSSPPDSKKPEPLEDTDLEPRLAEISRGGGLRIIGPRQLLPRGRHATWAHSVGQDWRAGYGQLHLSEWRQHRWNECGVACHIDFAKGIGIGNCIDLDTNDFLDHFAIDDEVQIIWTYL